MTMRSGLAACAALALLWVPTAAAAQVAPGGPVATAPAAKRSDGADIDAYLKAAAADSSDVAPLDGPRPEADGGCRPALVSERLTDGTFDARYPLGSRDRIRDGLDPRVGSAQAMAAADCRPDRGVHGYFSAGIGTGGYHDVSAAVVAPVGDATVGAAVESSRYGRRR